MRQQFGFGVEIGIGNTIGGTAGSSRHALLIAHKAAVAQAGAEVTTLDAIWQILRRDRHRPQRRAYRHRPKRFSHGVLRFDIQRHSQRNQTALSNPGQLTFAR